VADDSRERLLAAFGRVVRQLRRERGWSQEDLADRVGIDRTYMGGVERGERNPGLVNIARIATALEVPMSRLLADTEQLL